MIKTAGGKQTKAALCVALGLSLIGGVISAGLSSAARAQGAAEALNLSAPPAFQLAPSAETALPIQLTPSSAIPRRAIVLIRGLPSTVALSEGRLFESGVWGVQAADLGRLKISASSASSGRNELSISVVALDGTVLAETRSSLVIGDSGTAALPGKTEPSDRTVQTAASAREFPGATPSPKRLSAEESQRLSALLKKGDEQMAVGNVSAARLLYRHAAESGLPAAALALAASYDEQELNKLRVKGGVQPDQKQAQLWYEKARELGSTEARERLQRLGAR